jgi:V/A-type H+-transporting ATPase subunit E
MAEEIKDLIKKIQEEGIQVAQVKAKEIELEVKRKAGAILQKAQEDAEKIISEANEKTSRMEKSAKASIQQAGRDSLLSLRHEIDAIFKRLIQSSITQALSPAEMAKIITELIKKFSSHGKEDVLVLLKKEDLEKMENEFLSRLKDETKKGITLKSAQDISGGFIISFDSGKSHFDFTDNALAGYMSSFLKPHLSKILNEAI